jgi:hypothetical protein
MSEYITLKQIAKLVKVSEERARNMFSMGAPFAMVPRRVDAKRGLIVHRKDFMPLLEKKLAYDAEYSNETQRAWDLHFSTA